MGEWKNWSESIKFTPNEVIAPHTEEEVVGLVKKSIENGLTIRPVGSSHSSSKIFKTKDILLCMKNFNSLVSHDKQSNTATAGSGMSIEEAGKALYEVGYALHNQGDIDKQTLMGACSTSTHGTGKGLKILADFLSGVRIVDGKGNLIEYTEENHPEIMKGLRVSLGLFGIITAVKLDLEPAFHLHRQEWCSDIHRCMENLDVLIDVNRNFDFYWYPRSDEVKIRTWNLPGDEPKITGFARLVKDERGPSYSMLSRVRDLKYEEIEYGVPMEEGPKCFYEVRKAVKKFRKTVGWRILYRTIKKDENYLSIASHRDTATISFHQNNQLPYQEYFDEIEPIFKSYEGRPHWGKKHSLGPEELKKLYPEWEKFLSLRQMFDPHNIFLSSDMRQLLFGDEL